MDEQITTPPPNPEVWRVDRTVARRAAEQFGVVTRAQLFEEGLSRGEIDHRLSAGRLIPLHRGVYAVGHAQLEPRGVALAAVLACGPGAVASYLTAAVLWRIAFFHGSPHVTVPRMGGTARPGIAIHRTRHLPVDHVTRLDGIPITSPARTLLDLAEILPSVPFARAINEAEVTDVVSRAELQEIATQAQGRRGARRLLEAIADTPGATRSELEDAMRTLLKAARLPQPTANALILGMEVDFLWREHRLVVEVDGWAPHRTKRAFENDRRKTLRLQAAGYTVVRIAWAQLRDEPFEVVASLARLLAYSAASSHQ